MSINPDIRDRAYSVWAQDNAAECEDRRAKARPLLAQALTHLDWLAAHGGYLPGTSAEELAEHVREVLDGDWDCGRDRDVEKFAGETL